MGARKPVPGPELGDAVRALLPASTDEAARLLITLCAGLCIDAGMDDRRAAEALLTALAGLRARGAGHARH